MSHDLEFIGGKAAMVYTKSGGVPWHGFGFPIKDDMAPKEMLKVAKLNWTVEKVPAYATINGKRINLDTMALVRSSDHKILDEVSGDWNPLQNEEAFDFFREYCDAGNMSMETAGSLKGGRLVWVMAKIKGDKFALFKGKDVVESYVLLTNPFIYGMSISASLSMIRVVCANTLAASLSASKGDKIVRVTHRKEFIADDVKQTLGLAHERMVKYKEAANFLSNKKATPEQISEYLKQVFPVITQKSKSKKELSKNAKSVLAVMDTQPGVEFGRGTWWQALNAVTYHLDHSAGRNADTRLTSAYYGLGKKTKLKALELAVQMADAS